MITDGKKWHYLAVTNLSALLQGNSSNHEGDFYCLNCFNSYTSKNKLKEHEEICNNHNSCHIEMPKCFEIILKYNPGEKSLKAPFAIYFDLECLLKNEESRQNNNNNNNLEKSYTQKKSKHEPSGCALFTKFSFNEKGNKLGYCREKDCIEELYKELKKVAMKIINYDKKEMITYEENKFYKEQETCHICEESFVWIKMIKILKTAKRLKITAITQENVEELLIANAI